MIVVIGAGVCGLAAAYKLSRRGERTIVLERGKPFAEQVRGTVDEGLRPRHRCLMPALQSRDGDHLLLTVHERVGHRGGPAVSAVDAV